MAKEEKVDDLSPLREKPFAGVVEEFEKLMSQNNRIFLMGAGCSRCANLPLMNDLTRRVFNDNSLKQQTKNTLLYLQNQFEGGHGTTIEDYLSDMVDIIAIAARRRDCGATNQKVNIDGEQYGVDELEDIIDDIKDSLVKQLEPNNLDIRTHRKFVKAVDSLRTNKMNGHNRIDYFVLNYDTLIEDSLALECLPYVDGFDGGAVGWWDSSLYKTKDFVARVFKIHGSIDWRLLNDDLLPRRIRKGTLLNTINTEVQQRVMIWPAATKYRETQRDPYAQMLKYIREALNPAKGEEAILTICGYRFADIHVNTEIERALRESDKRLNIIIFCEDDEPTLFVKRWFENEEVSNQVRIHSKRGFFHGSTVYRADEDLPWWKFENIVRLLGGER